MSKLVLASSIVSLSAITIVTAVLIGNALSPKLSTTVSATQSVTVTKANTASKYGYPLVMDDEDLAAFDKISQDYLTEQRKQKIVMPKSPALDDIGY